MNLGHIADSERGKHTKDRKEYGQRFGKDADSLFSF